MRRLAPLIFLAAANIVSAALIPMEAWFAVLGVSGLLSVFLFRNEIGARCAAVIPYIPKGRLAGGADVRLKGFAGEVCYARNILGQYLGKAEIFIDLGEPVPWEPIRSRLTSIAIKLDSINVPHPPIPPPEPDGVILTKMYGWLDYLNILAPIAELGDVKKAQGIVIQ